MSRPARSCFRGASAIPDRSFKLGRAAALISSLGNAPLPSDAVFFGEVSLSGAVRPVAQSAARLKEAHKLGFARAFVPEPARGEAGPEVGLALTGIGGLADLVADIAQRGRRRGAPELKAAVGDR